MDASQPVACPLCGAVVSPRPDPQAKDIRDLDRHLADGCPGPASSRPPSSS